MIAVVVGTLAVIAVVIAVGLAIDRKLPLVPRPAALREDGAPRPPAHAAGDAPATAIRARGPQLARLRASRRCTGCRTTLVAAGADEPLRYGGRELLLVPLRCPKCGESRALYVAASE